MPNVCFVQKRHTTDEWIVSLKVIGPTLAFELSPQAWYKNIKNNNNKKIVKGKDK